MDPLVSVIISTYNSSRFIEETLESIAYQTWKEIEIIVTDDCSKDDTVEICRKWLARRNPRFSRTQLLTSNVNTGVSGNANRGLLAANGNWIKFLGADDTLKCNCLEDNMLFISAHPEIRVLFSKVNIYNNDFSSENFIRTVPGDPINSANIMSDNNNAESQYQMLLLSDRVHFSPSVFIHRETLVLVGGFDERFPMLEDYPLWLKLTRNGYRLNFMNRVTVNYRMHNQAINNTGSKFLVNPNYFKYESFRRLCIYPYLPPAIRLDRKFTWISSQIFRFGIFNKDTKFNALLKDLVTVYLNPFRYVVRIRIALCRNLPFYEHYL